MAEDSLGPGSAAAPDRSRALPSPPPLSARPPRIVVIGAGSRGRTYARAALACSNGIVVAVAEPDAYKREQFGRAFIHGAGSPPPEGSLFADWRDFVAWEWARRAEAGEGGQGAAANVPEGVDAAFVCVLDEMHHDVVVALAPLGLHVLCEKPLATRLADCVAMYRALAPLQDRAVFSVGHVLRYSPHNVLLRKLLLEDKVIGDVLSVVHTEPVGWWHFAHSYVRGNWRRESSTAPSLLTKSCHDIDLLLWLLCTPAAAPGSAAGPPHLPTSVASTGSLQFFRRGRKPRGAGAATNCLRCAVEPDCMYSSRRVYAGPRHQGLATGNTGWPVSVVLPDIEGLEAGAREPALLARLAEDYDAATTPPDRVAGRAWYGRCVFESDNDVCDEQVVTITWDDDEPSSSSSSSSPSDPTAADTTTEERKEEEADPPPCRRSKQAVFHMIAQTKKQCERYTHIYGTDGELYADSKTITVDDFRTGLTSAHATTLDGLVHGGGDVVLARQFILAVDRVKNHGWSAPRAQAEFIGCSLEDIIRSHAIVFAAEEARTGRKVVDWNVFWDTEVGSSIRGS